MSRDHQEWTELLSEYLDAGLEQDERARVEAHLAECGMCREVLASLRDVVASAAELPDHEPERDLWPGVASAIGGPARAGTRPGGASVIALPSAWRGDGTSSDRRVLRMRLGAAGGVAAAVALVSVSVGTTWWVAGVRTSAAAVSPTVDLRASDVLRAAEGGDPPPAELASELATLEEVLAAARDALDPNTVRVLERNLDVIERAIADSREALALDPGNTFLTEHLERMYRRKLVYLQDAVRVAQWSS